MPLAVALLIAVHFWRVRKDGGISGATVDRHSRFEPMHSTQPDSRSDACTDLGIRRTADRSGGLLSRLVA